VKSASSHPASLPLAGKSYWRPGDYSYWNGKQHVGAYLQKNYQLDMHSHGFIEANIIAKGHGWHYFDNRIFKTGPGDVYVIPVGVAHGYFSRDCLDIYHLLLHPRFMEDYGVKVRSLKGFIPFFTDESIFDAGLTPRHFLRTTGNEYRLLKKVMDILVYENYLPGAPADAGIQGLALYVIQLLCRYYCRQNDIYDKKGTPTPSRSLETVFRYIYKNYSGKISLKDLARAGSFQLNYLCRLFQQQSGMSPLDFVNHFRLLQAERLLLETDKRIKQIALLTGFYDAAHLSKTFMRLRGYPPSQLRN